MPRKRRALKLRENFTETQIVQLQTGIEFFSEDGFGAPEGEVIRYNRFHIYRNYTDEQLAVMRDAWHSLRDVVLAAHQAEVPPYYGKDLLPYGFWAFESPEPPAESWWLVSRHEDKLKRQVGEVEQVRAIWRRLRPDIKQLINSAS